MLKGWDIEGGHKMSDYGVNLSIQTSKSAINLLRSLLKSPPSNRHRCSGQINSYHIQLKPGRHLIQSEVDYPPQQMGPGQSQHRHLIHYSKRRPSAHQCLWDAATAASREAELFSNSLHPKKQTKTLKLQVKNRNPELSAFVKTITQSWWTRWTNPCCLFI